LDRTGNPHYAEKVIEAVRKIVEETYIKNHREETKDIIKASSQQK